jgi:hypothetical protein
MVGDCDSLGTDHRGGGVTTTVSVAAYKQETAHIPIKINIPTFDINCLNINISTIKSQPYFRFFLRTSNFFT